MADDPKKLSSRFQQALDKTKNKKDFSLNSQYVEGSLSDNAQGYVQSDDNINDLRGENQSGVDQLFNGLGKAVGKLGIRTIDGIGMLPYMLGLGKVANPEQSYLESIYNNPLSRSLDEITEKLNEALPNYQTDEEQNSITASLSGINFWADKLLDGVSYAGAAYLSGGAFSKILSGAGKLAKLSKAGKALGLGVKEEGYANNLVDIITRTKDKLPTVLTQKNIDGANQLASSLFSAGVESSAEARETYKNVYENLRIEKLKEKQALGDDTDLNEQEELEVKEEAKSAGNISFLTNLAITGGTNFLQFGRSFTSSHTDDAIKAVKNSTVSELGTDGVKTGNLILKDVTKKQKFINNLLKYGENPVEEAVQEGSQFFTNEFLTDYFSNSNESTRDLLASMSDALSETFGSKDGRESMLLGALIGGGMGTRSKIKQSKEQKEQVDKIMQYYNANNLPKNFQTIIDSASKSEEINEAKNEALKNGDIFNYKNLEAADLHNIVTSRIEAGKFEDIQEFADGIKNMTNEEFTEQFNVDASNINKEKLADNYVKTANEIKENYEKLQANFGHKHSKETLGHLSFVMSMSNDLENREKQLIESLKQKGFDYNKEIIENAKSQLTVEEQQKLSNNINLEIESKLNLQKDLKDQISKLKGQERINKRQELQTSLEELDNLKNEQIQISDFINETIVDENYRPLAKKISNNFLKNKLKTLVNDKFISNKIPLKFQKEFKTQINDLLKIQKTKDSYLDLYNTLSDDNFTEKKKNILEKLEAKKEETYFRDNFTIKAKKVKSIDGVITGAERHKLYLDKGTYNYDKYKKLVIEDKKIDENGTPVVKGYVYNTKTTKKEDFDWESPFVFENEFLSKESLADFQSQVDFINVQAHEKYRLAKEQKNINSKEYEKDDYIVEDDTITNRVPNTQHNGTNSPFSKTTYKNLDLIDTQTANENDKAFHRLQKIIQNTDKLEETYYVEYSLEKPVEFEELNYTPQSEDEIPIYTHLVDLNGNRVKLDINGKRLLNDKEIDYSKGEGYAIATLSSSNPLTSGGLYKFNDWNELNEISQKELIEKHADNRKQIISDLKENKILYSNITGKSLGRAKYDNEVKKITKSIKLDSSFYKTGVNKNHTLEIATSDTMSVNGESFNVKKGKVYFVDKAKGNIIPLNTRKLNENEINNIINGIIYQATAKEHDIANESFRKEFIGNYLQWGTGKENSPYNIYFQAGSKGTVVIYGYKNTLKTINLSELQNNKSEDFKQFLSEQYHQVNKSQIDDFNSGESKKYTFNDYVSSSEVKNNGKIYNKGYLEYLVDNVLTTKLVALNTNTDRIDGQYVNGYLRLADKTFNIINKKNKPTTANSNKNTQTSKEKSKLDFSNLLNVETKSTVQNNIVDESDPFVESFENNSLDTNDNIVTETLNKNPFLNLLTGSSEDTTENEKKLLPDFDPFANLDYSKQLDTEPKIKESHLIEAKKRFEEYGINFEKVKGLIDNRAFGRFYKSGKVLISDLAPVGTEYHEEFHIVEDLFLNQEQKEILYDEWRNINNQPNYTNNQVSESLAEEFRYYSLNKKYKNEKGKTINQFLKDLFEFIENLLSLKSDKINNLFNNIHTGKFTSAIKSKNVGNKLTVSEKDQLSRSFIFNYFKQIEDANIPIVNYFTSYRNRIEESLGNGKLKLGDFSAKENLILNVIKNIYENENTSVEFANKIQFNLKELKELFADKLAKLNIEVDIEEETDENEINNIRKEDRKSSNEIDHASKTSINIRSFLSSIQSENLNKLGLNEHIDIIDTVKKLHQDTFDIETTEELKTVLLNKSNSIYNQIYKKLYIDSNIDKLGLKTKVEIVNFQREFLQQFSKTQSNYVTSLIESEQLKEDDVFNSGFQGLTFKDINENKEANLKQTRLKFKSNFDTKLLNNYFEKESFKKIIGQFNKKPDINNTLILLKELGFEFSDSSLIGNNSNTFINDQLKKNDISSDNIIENTKYIVKELESGKNIFDNSISSKQRVNNLLEIEYQFIGNDTEFNIQTAEGKNAYSVQEQNGLSKKIKRLAQKGFDKLKLYLSNGQKSNNGSYYSNGISANNLSKTDMFVSTINGLLKGALNKQNSRVPYIFAGSKSTTYMIEGFNKFINTLNSKENEEKVINQYKEILKKEINSAQKAYIEYNKSIEKLENGSFNPEYDENVRLITNYHIKKNGERGDGTKLNIFNDILLNQSSINEIDFAIKNNLNVEILDQYDNDIKNHIQEQSRKIKFQMTDDSLIQYNEKSILINGISKDILAKYNLEYDNKRNIATINKIDTLLNDVVAFSEIALYNQLENLTGDLAFYKDPLKRFTGLLGTKKNMDLGVEFTNLYNDKLKHSDSKWNYDLVKMDKLARTIVVNDIVISDDNIVDRFDNNNIKKIYSEINTTDAQGYESLEFFRFRKLSQGEWTNDHELAYESELKGIPLTEYQVGLVSEKTQYFGEQDINGLKVPTFYKLSVFVPSLIKNTNLRKLGEEMDKKAISIVMFESANKVGRKVNKNNTGQDLFDENGNVNLDTSYIQNIDLSYYGTQLELNQKPKKTTTKGTQENEIIKTDLKEIVSEKEFDKITKNLDFLQIERANTEIELLEERLGIVKKENGDFYFKNKSKIIDILLDESKKRDLPDDFANGIKLLLSDDKSLDIFSKKAKLESILNAIVSNQVIKHKLTGDSKVQISSAGFTKDQITKSDELKFYNNGSGMEVYLPSHLQSLINKDNVIKLNNDLDNPLLQIIGFRIPTQTLNSIEYIKVKGFLPQSMGNMIVVPSQLTAKSGSDFDIDKLNLYFPNYYTKGKEDIYIQPYDINSFDNDYETYTKDVKKPISKAQFKIKALDNAYLKQHIDILKLEGNEKRMLTPNTDYNLKGLAKGQNDTTYKNEESVRGLRGKLKEYSKNIIDFAYLIDKKLSFEAGKKVLGVIALHNKHHISSQVADLKMNIDLYSKPNFKNYKNNNGDLNLIFDSQGRKISESISEFMNASVDVEKDDYIKDINLSLETASTYMYLIRLGIPMNQVVYFMSQPIITEYLRLQNLKESQHYKLVNNDVFVNTEDVLLNKLQEYNNIDVQFDTKILKEGIANQAIYSSLQKNVFTEFLKYKKDSDVLNEFMRISAFDTKGLGTSFSANKLYEIRFNKFMKSEDSELLINKENFFEKNGNQTYLGKYKDIVFNGNKYYNSLFKTNYLLDKANLSVVNTILESKKSEDDIVKTINKIKNELLTYIIQNQNKDSIALQAKQLMFGENSIANTIKKLKDSELYEKNYLIENLIPTFKSEIHNVIINNGGNIDTERSNKLSEGFMELYEINSQLALDLVKVSILQTGYNNSPFTLNGIIPTELMLEVAESFYNDNNIDFTNFEKNLALENINDNNIVPLAKRSQYGDRYVPQGYKFAKYYSGKFVFLLDSDGKTERLTNKSDKLLFKNYGKYTKNKTEIITDDIVKGINIAKNLNITKTDC